MKYDTVHYPFKLMAGCQQKDICVSFLISLTQSIKSIKHSLAKNEAFENLVLCVGFSVAVFFFCHFILLILKII